MDFTDDAPGADDDASGVAVSMELARVMATHDSAATLIFAAVAGEEQGLFGSAFMAAQFKTDGVDVQGMLDNDIVGSSTADDGTIDKFDIRMFVQGIPPTDSAKQITALAAIGGENDSPAHQLGRFVSEVSQNSVTQMNGMPCFVVIKPWLIDLRSSSPDHLSPGPFLAWRRPSLFPSTRFPSCSIHRTS